MRPALLECPPKMRADPAAPTVSRLGWIRSIVALAVVAAAARGMEILVNRSCTEVPSIAVPASGTPRYDFCNVVNHPWRITLFVVALAGIGMVAVRRRAGWSGLICLAALLVAVALAITAGNLDAFPPSGWL